MIGFSLSRINSQTIKILCLGAHCDDIEIGCGGTLLKILGANRNTEVYWVVFSSDPSRKKEATRSANLFLKKAGEKEVIIERFRNGYFPSVRDDIKDYFESLKTKISPDIIFTHYSSDLHQDHRVVSELTWNTFRNSLIFEYEIPKYDGDLGHPNFFVPIDASRCAEKIEIILDCFKTQSSKHWFTEDLFLSLLRIRGMEACSDSKYAEGFYCKKSILSGF